MVCQLPAPCRQKETEKQKFCFHPSPCVPRGRPGRVPGTKRARPRVPSVGLGAYMLIPGMPGPNELGGGLMPLP